MGDKVMYYRNKKYKIEQYDSLTSEHLQCRSSIQGVITVNLGIIAGIVAGYISLLSLLSDNKIGESHLKICFVILSIIGITLNIACLKTISEIEKEDRKILKSLIKIEKQFKFSYKHNLKTFIPINITKWCISTVCVLLFIVLLGIIL